MLRDGTNRRPGGTNGAPRLDALPATVDSSVVQRPSPQIRLLWIFGVASGLGTFSTLIAFVSFYLGAIATGQKFDQHGRHSHPTTTTRDVPVDSDVDAVDRR